MDHMKISVLILLIAAMAIAGCVSLGGNSATTPPKVIATVGAPTPVPTEPPEPTRGPTWTPTPTPVPPALTLSEFELTVKVNGDQRQWTQDPSQAQPVNAQYAARQDTAKFIVTNTGDADLKNLVIVYDLAVPMTTITNGQELTAINHQSLDTAIDTLNRGDAREINVKSPIYGAMLTVDLTITARWDGGSIDLYKTTLEPNFESGTSYSPANDIVVKQYGSAYN